MNDEEKKHYRITEDALLHAATAVGMGKASLVRKDLARADEEIEIARRQLDRAATHLRLLTRVSLF